MECTKVNCPMQAGTPTDNCGENCPWRTTAKTGDLISRAAAIKRIESIRYCGDFISALIHLPAVNAVPVVHGRWIKEADRDNRWHCSECKFVVGLEHRFYNYCFNCGAKMDGERRDSE